jgi:hypothetical protein
VETAEQIVELVASTARSSMIINTVMNANSPD